MRQSSTRSIVDNPGIIAYALYRLGAMGTFVDVEDLFVECYRLAPERFGWRKYPYPNYKTAYKALRDFEGHRPGLLIKTPDGRGRQLSSEGIRWVRERADSLGRILTTPGLNPPTRRPDQAILNHLRDHRLVKSHLAGEQKELAKYEVADLLLCTPDSSPAVWRERLDTYRSAAENANRHDLVALLSYLEAQRPDWFLGGTS